MTTMIDGRRASLHQAARSGDYGTVAAILRRSNRDINAPDARGQTALDIALSSFYVCDFSVSALVDAGATVTAANVCRAVKIGYTTVSNLLSSRTCTNGVVNGRGAGGWTALQLAMDKSSDYSIVSALLDNGADPNRRDPQGWTALHRAVDKNMGYAIVSRMLKKGANPNEMDPLGQTVLHATLHRDRGYAIISSLVDAGANVNLGDSSGRTVLHFAMMTKLRDIYIIICILSAQEADCNIQDALGRTALHYHATHGEKPEPTEHIAAARARHMQVFHQKFYAKSFHREAPREDCGERTILSALIHAGADVNLADGSGATPLFYASGAGHLAIVVALMAADADPNLPNSKGKTPLQFAFAGGHLDTVEALLQAGAVDTPDRQGVTCLHLSAATWKGNSILKLLILRGGNANVRDCLGLTPVHHAVIHGILANVTPLLAAGAIVNEGDQRGMTPLHYATARGSSIALVELLLQAGASLHQKDNSGMTALLHAARADADLNFIFVLLVENPTQLFLRD